MFCNVQLAVPFCGLIHISGGLSLYIFYAMGFLILDYSIIIHVYTNVIPYTYDSDIQYDMDWGLTVCEIRYIFCYAYIPNYRDLFDEPFSVVIC